MKKLFIFNFVILLSAFFLNCAETFGQAIKEHNTNQIDYKVRLEKGDAGIYLEGNCSIGISCGSGLEIYIFDAEKKSYGGLSVGCNYKEYFDDFGNVIRRKMTRCNLDSDDSLFIVPKTGIYTLSVINQEFSEAGFFLRVFQNIAGKDDQEVLSKSLILQAAKDDEEGELTSSTSKSSNNYKSKDNCNGFNGIWDTEYGQVTITVNGSKAEGKYLYQGSVSTISGNINGSVLEGKYREVNYPNLKEYHSGRLKFTLVDDGWTGQWWQPDGSLGGVWSGTCTNNK